mmetsp:Transcript_20612/g.23826  ORF Transcript_20612/g.23826 Transcript_20612/m.23826 type:complete len:87 (+) Transcript_20612:286-546(+)
MDDEDEEKSEDLQEAQELFEAKSRVLAEEFPRLDLYDGTVHRIARFERLPKVTRECLDKDLEAGFKKMVEAVEGRADRNDYSIWPE